MPLNESAAPGASTQTPHRRIQGPEERVGNVHPRVPGVHGERDHLFTSLAIGLTDGVKEHPLGGYTGSNCVQTITGGFATTPR